ncbi:PDR/VanB family oxidoreductase [Mycobacterium sp. NAZ190054]|uniref:PDR/VanB family oxidoreductase n=1 Tax=Mycobacterium sp. NAZ190054 TaxID=1747766 RepID=UPI00079AC220|nr:PDR/VanB family oxidoreductase [Mycobacterium sp. NAZ190054]KWX69077.1 ferredoxin [Mycobacterium sp. NAZ190054]
MALVTASDDWLPAQLEVVAIEDAAEEVRVFTLSRPDGAELPHWEPGTHLEVLIPGEMRRHYSLCGPRASAGRWTIGVLRDRHSRGGSAYLHDEVAVGQQLTVTGVRNRFPFVTAPEYVFVAGGIGITPILPMIDAAEAAGAGWRLYYGGRRRASMAFLDRLAPYGGQVTVTPEDECGLIDVAAALASARAGAHVYGCGPEPLLAALEQAAKSIGMPLHVERFAASADGTDSPAESFEVELARSGSIVEIPADRSIVTVLEEIGVMVPTSCLEGICGTCETKVLSGTPEHRDSILSEDERRTGDTMMPCVSRSCSPRLVLDL